MHELFTKVLSKRDLSRAGDLFSVADDEIVNGLTEVLSEIDTIISQNDYQKNANDQSVVEICVTRILSCIRETKTAERYCSVLVRLLATCLQHCLRPVTSSKVDPPHAKIAADIISSIFLNYNKKPVMEIALPVAVQFLQKGNAEMSRNLASYLSLAAIEYASLLSPHVEPILDSIAVDSNFGLCRVLAQIYEEGPDQLVAHVAGLVHLLARCETPERLALLQLFSLVATNRPMVLEGSISQLCEQLDNPSTVQATMQVLLPMAEFRSHLVLPHFAQLKAAATETPATITLAAQIMAAAGKANKEKAQFALDFVLEHLPHADRSAQTILLHEATMLCSTYPILFNEKVLACVRQRNALSQQTTSQPTSSAAPTNEVKKTSGGITIVKLNAQTPPLAVHKPFVQTTIDPPPTMVTTSPKTKVMNGHPSSHVRPRTPSQTSNSATGHVVTIYTSSSMTTSATSSSNTSESHSNPSAAGPPPPPPTSPPPHLVASSISTTPAATASTTTTPNGAGVGYTRRAKLGDSRSTGRLHSAGNTHRSMTRLNIAGGSVGGLHKSMTRLSSSQQINNQNQPHLTNTTTASGTTTTANNTTSANSGNNLSSNVGSLSHTSNVAGPNYVTPVPPLSSNVIITGHNRWGIPSTKITSGGVTVTTSAQHQQQQAAPRVRPHSQGPTTLMGSTGALGAGKLSGSALNQSTGSISLQQQQQQSPHSSPPPATTSSSSHHLIHQTHHISVQHANTMASSSHPSSSSAASTYNQHHTSSAISGAHKSVMTLPVNSTLLLPANEVIVTGPTTVTSRRNNDNTSVTLLNHHTSSGGGTGTGNSIINQRMSTFEPYQIMRDTVQQFCEKHFASIKEYMDRLSHRLPPPTRCGIEERRTKKVAKLHFACQIRGPHCLYSKTCFTMRTRNPKTWIHLMFLDFQIRNYVKDNCALSTREPGISNLKNMWNMIRTENKSFTELVTSNFPSVKEQEALVNELRHSGFLDVFEVSRTDRQTPNSNELEFQWGCFLCNHPEKAVGFLHGTNQPMIEGQLKEKKGKWRLFRRWRTRYFTLSGAHLSCKGSSGGESIDVNQIRSVKVSRGARNIPKAFEIFTGDQTLILKPKDGKNAEEWVQCLNIVVAHSQARDNPTAKTNSLPARGLGNSRTAF